MTNPPERFDAVVIGAGPAGEAVVSGLLDQGMRVALVERELVGGECAYWACIPSKTLLRPPEVRSHAGHVPGVKEPALEWPEARSYRDYMIRDLDDGDQLDDYAKRGVTVIKATAAITGPGKVQVDSGLLETDRIVIASGSAPQIPPIDGIDTVPYWTNREATTLTTLPDSATVLGGGPVGIELAQMLHRYGTDVTLIESGERLLEREDAVVGELIASHLASEGIEVRTSSEVEALEGDATLITATLAGGEEITAERLIVATGRQPRLTGLGLETVGIDPDAGKVAVDERCRAADGVWAVGDATDVMPFTHVGKYQARIASADIAGKSVAADYSAIPRVVFCEPEVAAVGLTERQAREQGRRVEPISVKLGEEIAKPVIYERDGDGTICLVVDRGAGVVVGAWAVAPQASEWIHVAALAIKAKLPFAILEDFVPQFPTFSEGYMKAFARLSDS